MRAAVTTGHGGLDRLAMKTDWPVPKPGPGEVLLKVGVCGCNNTDINTRTAWYSETVRSGVMAEGGSEGFDLIVPEATTWGGGKVAFPRIQGADAVDRIVATGEGVDPGRIEEHIMVNGWLRRSADIRTWGYRGSETDDGFADYAVCPAVDVVPVRSGLSDVELASFMVAFFTAEGMVRHARPQPDEWVLVTGASLPGGNRLCHRCRRRSAASPPDPILRARRPPCHVRCHRTSRSGVRPVRRQTCFTTSCATSKMAESIPSWPRPGPVEGLAEAHAAFLAKDYIGKIVIDMSVRPKGHCS